MSSSKNLPKKSLKKIPQGVSGKTSTLVSYMEEYSRDQNVEPISIRYCDFVKWLKDVKQIKEKELSALLVHLSNVGSLASLKHAFFDNHPTDAITDKIALKKTVKGKKDELEADTRYNIYINRLKGLLHKDIKEWAKHTPRSKFSLVDNKKARSSEQTRVLTLMINDTHFGSRIDAEETGSLVGYDFVEEARALSSVIARTCAFKVDHRKETTLVVVLNGDIIGGKIHDREHSRAAAEQVADALWLLSQAIRILSNNFSKVEVYCVAGNHDRDPSRHPERAMQGRWDSRVMDVYFGLKVAVMDRSNVTVNIPKTPHLDWTALEYRFYANHGDVSFMVPRTHKAIQLDQIKTQMKELNLAAMMKNQKPYSVFLIGHNHEGIRLPTSYGELIIGPALTPLDAFAKSIGVVAAVHGQTLIETVKGYPVGDMRFLFIDENMLTDSSLDNLIVPFSGF